MVFAAAMTSPLLQTGRFDQFQFAVAALDFILLVGLVAIAVRWFRRWLYIAIGCQGMTVIAHGAYLLNAPLPPEAYGTLTIMWSYPLLGALAWGAWQNGEASQIAHGPDRQGVFSRAKHSRQVDMPASRSDLEVMARLFRTQGCGDRADTFAAIVLERVGSLAAATQQKPERLRRWGLDEQAIAALELARETLVAALRSPLEQAPIMADSQTILDYLRLELAHLREEQLCVVFLDANHRLLGQRCIGSGSVNAVFTAPQQLLREAIDMGASHVMLAHNHPSGNPAPSTQDVRFTRQVADALGAAGIRLVDHLIITRSDHVSLRAQGFV